MFFDHEFKETENLMTMPDKRSILFLWEAEKDRDGKILYKTSLHKVHVEYM